MLNRKPSNRFKVVLFDMDGTLADTDLMLVLSYVSLFEHFRPDYKPTLKELTYFSGPALTDTLKRVFPDVDPTESLKEFKRISIANYEKYVVGFPHTKPMLDELKNHGIKVGIVTSKLRPATNFTLRLIGLEDYFDFIVGLDEVALPKPDPEGIYKAMHFFGVSPKDVLYVGDTIFDFEAARRAGTKVCLVTWNLRQLPTNIKADYYINDYNELPEVAIHGK